MIYALHQMWCISKGAHRQESALRDVEGAGVRAFCRANKVYSTIESNEAGMESELNLLEVWIPEQMQPGTMFMLEDAGQLGKVENPFWAVLACPACGSLGLITRQQFAGLEAMICGASTCSSEYFLEGGTIRYRRAN
jgi:hypothetical protein